MQHCTMQLSELCLKDKLGDAGESRGCGTGGEQGLDVGGCAELLRFSWSSQS